MQHEFVVLRLAEGLEVALLAEVRIVEELVWTRRRNRSIDLGEIVPCRHRAAHSLQETFLSARLVEFPLKEKIV